MEITFLNGSGVQRGAFLEATRRLRNFDFDVIQATVSVEFSSDPIPDTEVREFGAAGSLAPGVGHITMRHDFPAFGAHPRSFYGTPEFAREVVIHEFGHLFHRWLQLEREERVAEMIGAPPQSFSHDAPWEDRPQEGIAETFKDAFLPAHLRQSFNRTNRRIALPLYPEFRELFRHNPSMLVFDRYDSDSLATDYTIFSNRSDGPWIEWNEALERVDVINDPLVFHFEYVFYNTPLVDGRRGVTGAGWEVNDEQGPPNVIIKALPPLQLLPENALYVNVNNSGYEVIADIDGTFAAWSSENAAFAWEVGVQYWIWVEMTGDHVDVAVYSANPEEGASPDSTISVDLPGEIAEVLGAGVSGYPGILVGNPTAWWDDFVIGAEGWKMPEPPNAEIRPGGIGGGTVRQAHRVVGSRR